MCVEHLLNIKRRGHGLFLVKWKASRTGSTGNNKLLNKRVQGPACRRRKGEWEKREGESKKAEQSGAGSILFHLFIYLVIR